MLKNNNSTELDVCFGYVGQQGPADEYNSLAKTEHNIAENAHHALITPQKRTERDF